MMQLLTISEKKNVSYVIFISAVLNAEYSITIVTNIQFT